MATVLRGYDQVPRRRFEPVEAPPGEVEIEEAVGPWQLVERYRARVEEFERLYGEVCEQRDRALGQARAFEEAWITSAARRDALSRALARLLRASKRLGYRPREFAARGRAHAVLTGIDPFDARRTPADIA
jgi:hypothetical protein